MTKTYKCSRGHVHLIEHLMGETREGAQCGRMIKPRGYLGKIKDRPPTYCTAPLHWLPDDAVPAIWKTKRPTS